jgi:phage shock protein C
MKTYKKKLYRSEDNKIVAGIMGGLGEYFDIDPVLFRVLYLAFSIFTGVFPGVFAYILMMLIVPKSPKVIHVKSENQN